MIISNLVLNFFKFLQRTYNGNDTLHGAFIAQSTLQSNPLHGDTCGAYGAFSGDGVSHYVSHG